MQYRIKTFILLFLFTFLTASVYSQTNVSGTISSNTTWNIAGSPYIIWDTVYMDGGTTLTIEPGVIVRFRNKAALFTFAIINGLPQNDADIIAVGTSTNPIIFTSDSSAPSPGIWSSINMNHNAFTNSIFNYCIFEYASYALRINNDAGYSTVKNCIFKNNNIGIIDGKYVHIDSCTFINNTSYGILTISFSTISNCYFSNNQVGLLVGGNYTDVLKCNFELNQTGITVYSYYKINIDDCIIHRNQNGLKIISVWDNINVRRNQIDSNTIAGIIMEGEVITIDSCQIFSNQTGIIDNGGTNHHVIKNNKIENNSLGLLLGESIYDIYCNSICNNSNYNIKSASPSAIDLKYNHWCTSDTLLIENLIFDGNDSANIGLTNILPFFTMYYCTTVDINENLLHNFSFSIFPNPSFENLNVFIKSDNSISEIQILNVLGQLQFTSTVANQNTKIDISTLPSGIYFIKVKSGNEIGIKKFIKH